MAWPYEIRADRTEFSILGRTRSPFLRRSAYSACVVNRIYNVSVVSHCAAPVPQAYLFGAPQGASQKLINLDAAKLKACSRFYDSCRRTIIKSAAVLQSPPDQVIARLSGLSDLVLKQTSESIEAVRQRVTYLEKHGVKVIVFKPHFIHEGGDLKGCFARPLKKPAQSCALPADARKTMEAEFQPLVDALAKTHPSVKFFDQNELLCDGPECSFVLEGMSALRDKASHYSEFASNALGELFAKWARTNAPGILSGGVDDSVASETKSHVEARQQC